MKLVEILARELREWPGAIDAIVQRSTGVIYLYGSSDPIFRVHLADDWALAIVTIGEWKAERARIATNQQATKEARAIASGRALDEMYSTPRFVGESDEEFRIRARKEEAYAEIMNHPSSNLDGDAEHIADLTAIACGKRSKEDQELWDKVAFEILQKNSSPGASKAIIKHDSEQAAMYADAFMAEREKRMKG